MNLGILPGAGGTSGAASSGLPSGLPSGSLGGAQAVGAFALKNRIDLPSEALWNCSNVDVDSFPPILDFFEDNSPNKWDHSPYHGCDSYEDGHEFARTGDSFDTTAQKLEPYFRDGAFCHSGICSSPSTINDEESVDESGRGDNTDPSWLLHCSQDFSRNFEDDIQNSVQEFEPHALHDGAFWTCDVNMQQHYPWTRDHLKDDDCASHEQLQNSRCVSFNNVVSVRCISEHSCFEADFHIQNVHDQLRHFWHLDGQIATGSDIFATLRALQHTGEIQNLKQGSTLEMNKVAAAREDQPHVNEDFASTAHANLWWNDLIENKFPSQDRRPVFVSTWYLAPGRFHLCIRCRRIKVHAEMSADDFERACRIAWHELDTGQHLNVFLVDGTPPGLPSTIACKRHSYSGAHGIFQLSSYAWEPFTPASVNKSCAFSTRWDSFATFPTSTVSGSMWH